MSVTDSERAGMNKASIQGNLWEFNAHIPAVVDKVNDDGTVDVFYGIYQPRMFKDGTRNNDKSNKAYNVEVKMLSSCVGGLGIRIPLRKGCRGYIHFSDFDHDNFFLGNVDADGVSEPHTSRIHSWTDAVFEPAFEAVGVTKGDCMELFSNNVTVKICEDGFDVVYNGESLMDKLNTCCRGAFAGWKP